jgi:hypothetical protein
VQLDVLDIATRSMISALITPFVTSVVYPLHLPRAIDRQWLQRSEETASVRARVKVTDFLRGAAVIPKECDVAGPPCPPTALAM